MREVEHVSEADNTLWGSIIPLEEYRVSFCAADGEVELDQAKVQAASEIIAADDSRYPRRHWHFAD